MNYGETTVAIIEVKDGNPVGAIQELLRSMLSQGLVSAILVPQEIPSKKTVVQTLVRDPAQLNAVNPLAPVFGVNTARILTKICGGQMAGAAAETTDTQEAEGDPAEAQPAATEQEEQPEATQEQDSPQEQANAEEQSETKEPPTAEEQPIATEEQSSATEEQSSATEEQSTPAPIGVVLRPCEVRALVELVKLQQTSMDPFLVIGVDCWGTYSVQDYAAKVSEGSQDSSVTADFLKQVTAGNLPEDLRGACLVCQHPAAACADLAIHLIGEDINQQIRVQANTEKGQEVFKALELEETPDSDEREKAVASLKDAKKQSADQAEVDFLETISSLCINCHNCRAVCPICYCKQCVFDGDVFEYPMEKYLNLSQKKGVLGMPPDKMLFHLTRMSHVATSCVACGQCEAACPSGIPLGQVYQKISAAAQAVLEYEAGRSLDEELPLTTFREEELSVVEN
jgi:formate dehydrogenase subunit beta